MIKKNSLSFALSLSKGKILVTLLLFITTQGYAMNITKIVIPAAGFGTRFLPFTKAIPKEMLPLINKPALQEVVQEGIASGVHSFDIIISKQKPHIKEYFSRNPALEKELARTGKSDALTEINSIIDHNSFNYIVQDKMLGLGHALLMAKKSVGNQPFGVILPDDIVFAEIPCMAQLIKVAQEYNATVIAVMEISGDEISSYGCIKPGAYLTDDIMLIDDIIEKPKPSRAFSNLGIIGRYVFTPAIFQAIEAIAPHAQGEIQLTDAITYLVKQGHKVIAYKIKGKRFDLGRPAGWLAANIYLGTQ